MKSIKHSSNPLFLAIRQAQERQRQKNYQQAIQREKMLLLQRQKKDEALNQKLFFASELEKTSEI
jgi:hypothetical protein